MLIESQLIWQDDVQATMSVKVSTFSLGTPTLVQFFSVTYDKITSEAIVHCAGATGRTVLSVNNPDKSSDLESAAVLAAIHFPDTQP